VIGSQEIYSGRVDVMPQFNVDFSRNEHQTIEVEAADKRSALAAARLKAPAGFKAEGVESLEGEPTYESVSGECERCGQMLFENDDYGVGAEDECYTCGACMEKYKEQTAN
jgi:hypothetical protein